jgi:nucleotide-binding universal stress UspA family protein
MPIKTILVAASGGSATAGAFELACGLAARLKAHVEGYHVLLDPLAAFAAFGADDGVVVSGSFINELVAKAEAAAAEMKAAFEAAAQRHGLAPAGEPGGDKSSSCWRQEAGYAPSLVARRARFFDLVVLGRSERAVRGPSSDTIEETLRESGRPVLLAPSKAPSGIGRSIALAWNGSAEAVRALAVALPMLAAAEKVQVITAGDAADSDAAEVITHLAWHGVAAARHNVPFHFGDGIGTALLEAAKSAGADLLVMGGYGHLPLREALFGGATREVIGTDAPLPLLLVH